MLELLLKLRVLTAQAAMVGTIVESYWYCDYMMGVHRELEYFYSHLGTAVQRDVDLEATIKMGFKLPTLEADILTTFNELLAELNTQARKAYETDLAGFKRMLDVVCYTTELCARLKCKLEARDFEPAPVADY